MSDQLPIPELSGRPGRPARVAAVALDTPVPHLDQEFDYSIPEELVGVAPGVRVTVPLAGRLVGGWVTEVRTSTTHPGRLSPIRRLVSPVPVLTPEVLQLCRDVARANAGTLPDVLRLAVPARQARIETAADLTPRPVAPIPAPVSGWEEYTGGPALLRHLREGSSPRAVWTALPGVAGGLPAWIAELRTAVAATLASGRRALVVVPTTREVDQVHGELATVAPAVRYHGDLTPAARYRAFLAILAGHVDIVVGTRSAAFAPVPDLGLVALWDPDDDNLREQHAPYPTSLGVVSHRRSCALLVGSYSRSVITQQLIVDGWAQPLGAARAVVRERAPRVEAPDTGDLRGEALRLPSAAFQLVRQALESGPVLIHVPLAGYLRSIRCANCQGQVRCRHCGGPLALGHAGAVSCGWCGRHQVVTCPACGSGRLSAFSVGSERTSEEIARAFPGVRVVLSTARTGITASVDSRPALVIATPGSEPVPEGGYAAALILDAAVATARTALDTGSVALDRWLTALALVRGAAAGGRAMILGNPDPAVAQACVRWDPAGFAQRELDERGELHFPPVWRLAKLDGATAALTAVARELAGTPHLELLGPVDGHLIARVPRAAGRDLLGRLRAIQVERSARKEEVVRVHVDPSDL